MKKLPFYKELRHSETSDKKPRPKLKATKYHREYLFAANNSHVTCKHKQLQSKRDANRKEAAFGI
jgi:hypothetical protein